MCGVCRYRRDTNRRADKGGVIGLRNVIYKTMVIFMCVFALFEAVRYVWEGSTCILDLLLAIMCGIASLLFVLEIDDEEVKKNDKRRK